MRVVLAALILAVRAFAGDGVDAPEYSRIPASNFEVGAYFLLGSDDDPSGEDRADGGYVMVPKAMAQALADGRAAEDCGFIIYEDSLGDRHWGKLCEDYSGASTLKDLVTGAAVPKPWNFWIPDPDSGGVFIEWESGTGPAPDPPGLFSSPSGAPGAAGTYAAPYNLREVLDGTAALAPAAVVQLLPGVYDDPQAGPEGTGIYRVFDIVESDITIQPFAGPYTAQIKGRFLIDAAQNNVTIKDLLFTNFDPIPGGEPTPAGSPTPLPKPLGWDDWGAVGVGISGGDGHVIANNAVYGGSQSFDSFQATGVIWYGNIAYNQGWTGTDRVHGHALYIHNPSPLLADRLVVKHNLISTAERTRTKKGNYAGSFFATTVPLENIEIDDNAFKGAITVSSEQFVSDVEFTDNIMYELDPPAFAGDGGNEFSFGIVGKPDTGMLFTGNTMIDGMKSLEGNGWTFLTANGTRVFKTTAAFWRTAMRAPPADPVLEEGVFTDVSGGGGVDESVFWLNTYDANRANFVILDLDLDGSVDVDPSTLLSGGDDYAIYHYADVTAVVQSGTYTSGTITIPVVDNFGTDRMDMFIIYQLP